jgi:heme/copper-type cytochrome/quinol oxidase subunit 3
VNVAGLIRMRWLVGTLLIAAAALFAIGVATEGDVHQETVASVEAGEHSEATEHNERSEASETGEELFGVNLESTPLVVLAVIISVALAAATWRTDHKLILLATAVFAAAFAVLDVAEFSHQIRESATTIAALAGIIAVLHAAAELLAEQRRAATP